MARLNVKSEAKIPFSKQGSWQILLQHDGVYHVINEIQLKKKLCCLNRKGCGFLGGCNILSTLSIFRLWFYPMKHSLHSLLKITRTQTNLLNKDKGFFFFFFFFYISVSQSGSYRLLAGWIKVEVHRGWIYSFASINSFITGKQKSLDYVDELLGIKKCSKISQTWTHFPSPYMLEFGFNHVHYLLNRETLWTEKVVNCSSNSQTCNLIFMISLMPTKTHLSHYQRIKGAFPCIINSFLI